MPCSVAAPCAMPFFPGKDFKGVEYHSNSRRLHFYMVWDFGLFTTRLEAERVGDGNSIRSLFTFEAATRKWRYLCRRRHCSMLETVSDDSCDSDPDTEDGADGIDAPVTSLPQRSASTAPATGPAPPVARHMKKRLFIQTGPPAPTASARKKTATPVPEEVASRASSRVASSLKRDTPLPLYLDDSDEEQRLEKRETPTPTGSPEKKRGRPASPSVLSSGTVSSASLLSSSTASLTAVEGGASISSDPHRLRGKSARGVSKNPSVAGPSSAAGGATVEAAPLLFNARMRKVYKDPQLAMDEMEPTDSLQVYEYEELVEYLSAGPKGKGRSMA